MANDDLIFVSNQNDVDQIISAIDLNIQAAFDLMPVIVWISDANSQCIFLNKCWYDYTGQSPETGLGAGWISALHPDDIVEYGKIYTEADEKQTKFQIEYRVRGKEGDYRWYLNSGNPQFDNKGNFRGFIGTAIDIHERKLSEEKIRKSEAYYKSYADTMPDMAFIADSKGNIIYYNQRWYEYIGNLENTKGWEWKNRSIHHPDDLETTINRWMHSLETGEPYEIEYRLRRQDGKYFWHLGRAMPIYDSNGNIEFWFGTNTNIHSQKMSEDALKDSEQRMRIAASAAELGVFEMDAKKAIWENEHISHIFGISHNNSLTKNEFYEKVIHPDDTEAFDQAFKNAWSIRGEIFNVQFRIRRLNDGEWRWIDCYIKHKANTGVVGVIKDITENRAMEEKLRESEKLYRLLASNLPNGAAFILDKDLRYLLADGPALEMAGWHPAKYEGCLFGELIDEPLIKLAGKNLFSALDGNASIVYSAFQNHHFKTAIVPIYNPEGDVTNVLAVMYDITELKKLETELKNERELLQKIYDNIPVMLSIYDPQINVSNLNQAVTRITGWTPEDYAKKNIMELTYPNPNYRKTVKEYMASLSPGFKDLTMTTKSGNTIQASWANIRISDGRNVGIGIDVSERKAYEQQLSMLTKQLQTVIDNITDGVVIYGPDKQMIGINKSATQIISTIVDDYPEHYSPNMIELYGPDGEQVSPDDWPISRVTRGDHFIRQEYLTRNKLNNREVYLEYSGIPIYEDDNLTLAIITVQDITERKKTLDQITGTNELLKQKNLDLEKVNNLHENLLYIVAHDLRNPIGNMYLILDLMRGITDGAEKDDYMGMLKAMVKRQENIVLGLVELLEVQSPDKVVSDEINLRNLVDDIISEYQAALSDCGATVNCNFEAAPVLNHIPSFVSSILKNLVNNAIKYRSEDRKLILDISSKEKDGHIVISIRDNGIGIDIEKYKKNMFQPFKRFTKQSEGTGMGLYLIRNLIEKNGGRIEVDSQPGAGTCFYCYFKKFDV